MTDKNRVKQTEPKLYIGLNETKCWVLNCQYHRDDGPAIEFQSGRKEWFINGKRHRIDGPAVITTSGNKNWFLNNLERSYEEWFQDLTPEQQYNYLWNLNE